MTSLRATVRHVRAARLCTAGARAWLTRHGVSWTEFIEHGVSVDFLLQTGDPLAQRVATEAQREQDNGGRG